MNNMASKSGAPAEWPAKAGSKELNLESILAEQAGKPTCPKCGFLLKQNGTCTICAIRCFVCGYELEKGERGELYCTHCKAQRDASGR